MSVARRRCPTPGDSRAYDASRPPAELDAASLRLGVFPDVERERVLERRTGLDRFEF